MRCLRYGQFLLVVTLGISFSAWGQGGGQAGRGAAAQGAATQQSGAAGRGGARGAGGGGAAGFFNYDPTASSGMQIPDARPVETRQKITINGEPFAYTARAGYLPLRNSTTGLAAAHLFFTYYAKDGVSDLGSRPLMVFLGGAPGVSTAWQEFGGLGPKRMSWPVDVPAGQTPRGWVDNPSTLLDQADLVFVNPVGTGYSRPDQPSRGPEFWSTNTDVASLSEFVRSFLNTYDRRNSPLFLAGEDFGTGRAAGLANYLYDHQIPVQGVVLLSMTPSADSLAGDTQYLTLLPSEVLAAWYHKKLAPELQSLGAAQIADQARQFAAREYLHALYKGDRMTPEERTKVVADLSRLTGLSKAFITNNNLRISPDRFNAELLREQRRALALSDARVTGFVPATGGGGRGGGGGGGGAAPIDYNLSNLAAGFLNAYEAYLNRDLTFTSSSGLYYLLSGGIGTFTSTGNDDASLSGAFARNPRLRLFAAVNLFDLSVPFYAAEFTLAHLSVSPEIRTRNITAETYEAGQMVYVDSKALSKLHADLAKFMNQAISPAKQ
jgi:carboxypeptidase C (cathepsin A)